MGEDLVGAEQGERERTQLIVREECPALHPMRRDERAIEERYNEQDVETVLAELEEAARELAAAFERLDDEQWRRSAMYVWPQKAERSLVWIAQHTVHECVHHLEDVVRGSEDLRSDVT